MSDHINEKTNLGEPKDSLGMLTKLSERGMAITYVANVDDFLKKLLRATFIADEKLCDSLLDDPGVLSTLGSRIQVAFALGLLSPRERKMLDLIRRIRNDFGHTAEIRSFDESPIRERCLELDPSPETCEAFTQKSLDQSKPLDRFFSTIAFLILTLERKEGIVRRCQSMASTTDEELASWFKERRKRQRETTRP